MKQSRVVILTILIILGLYDLGAVWFFPDKLPSISGLCNRHLFQFHFWEFVLGLTLGHLCFNRNSPEDS